MSDAKEQFTREELLAATFRVSVENNAMLRLVLHNQAQIIKHLGIEIPIATDLYADLVPGSRVDEESLTPLFFKQAENLADFIQSKAWAWSQMNMNISDQENP